MRVNIFKSVKASWPEETELDRIVCMMQSSQEISLRTLLYRKYRASGNKAEAEQMKITRFPAYAPCALFDDRKGREYVIGLTDLCYLDFDNVKEETRLIDAMETLRNDRSVLMASRSVSGEGLHILIRYKQKGMELPPQRVSMTPDEMQEMYSEVYDYFAAKYQQKLGMIADYHAAHMDRVYIVSYNSELYYNPNAEPLTIDLDEPINGNDKSPSDMSIGWKMREAERMISSSRLEEAERLLMENREWMAGNNCSNSEVANLDDYLAQVKTAKGIIARVDELMKEVDECLRDQDIKTAHEKIMESQHLLKTITGLCKPALIKVRKRVVVQEMKMDPSIENLGENDMRSGLQRGNCKRMVKRQMIFDKTNAPTYWICGAFKLEANPLIPE